MWEKDRVATVIEREIAAQHKAIDKLGQKRVLASFERKAEFRRSFLKLVQIREGRIREMDFGENGKQIWVYPSLKDLITACRLIMEYTAGKPEQRISMDVIGEAQQVNAIQVVLNLSDNKEEAQEKGILLQRPQSIREISETG